MQQMQEEVCTVEIGLMESPFSQRSECDLVICLSVCQSVSDAAVARVTAFKILTTSRQRPLFGNTRELV